MSKIEENVKSLAVIAHDLKAPLSAVVDLLNVVEKGYVDDPVKVLELITRARKKSEGLIRIVEDILDYTLLENKSQMKRERLNLIEIIDESYSIIEHYARQNNISIHYSQGSCREKYVFGNYTFLLRAFNNVIMNAVKYNKENGRIDIRCFEKFGRLIVVEISDTGIGIPPEDIESIFTIFSRGKKARRNIDGSIGLGLSLVNQIIKDHEGSIDVDSTVGVGTTLTIKLPLMN
ncbi:MAG: HAMP domain-containing histidine kinase [Candidatus Aminicenantes bacterium]|nr:HAMP domain-containing histidine kinase [Candidatus Aminicenantes bacterium]